MMQQRIVADPQAKPPLTEELLNEVGSLITTARHINTLVSAVQSHVSILLRAEERRPGFYQTSEWEEIQDLLNMVDEKADHVQNVAERVEASEWLSRFPSSIAPRE